MRKSHSPFLYYNNRPIPRYEQMNHSSRRVEQKMKSFLKKPFIFSKKLLHVFERLFSPLKQRKNKENALYLKISFGNACRFKKKPYLCIAFETRDIGRLAQLVQSICLTSRGSAVRIRQRPLKLTSLLVEKRISGV